MVTSGWLDSFTRNLSRRSKITGTHRRRGITKSTKPSLPAELLEQRTLLSVSSLVINGTDLNIIADGDEDITVRANNGQLEVLVGSTERQIPQTPANNIPIMSVGTLTSIRVDGGSQANTIDLSALTVANGFSSTLQITVNGGHGDDVLIGSVSLSSQLRGGDGADILRGGDAADILDGGDGADTIFGDIVAANAVGSDATLQAQINGGNDTINGGDGADSIQGIAGNDVIDSGDGHDLVYGGQGADSVFADNGSDSLFGGLGNDTLNGDGGTDVVSGGFDNDLIYGGELADTLNGDEGNDIIRGNSGSDSIDGGADNDSILGDSGNDIINGGDGNDTLNGINGNDSINGGAGNDRIIGGAGNDTATGGTGDDNLLGNGGDDSLTGGGGADTVNGNAGDDIIESGIEDPNAPSAQNPVTISVVGQSITEGNAGTTNLVFTLSLSRALTVPVTVTANTASGSATSGTDFLPITNQTVTFNPGIVQTTVAVSVNGDVTPETTETVRFILSAPSAFSQLAVLEALGNITDDDVPTTGLVALSPGGGQMSTVNSNNGQSAILVPTGLTNTIDISAGQVANPTSAIGLRINGNAPEMFTISTTTGVVSNVIPVGQAGTLNTRGDVALDSANNVLFAASSTLVQAAQPRLFEIPTTGPQAGTAIDRGVLQFGGQPVTPIIGGTGGQAAPYELDYLAYGNGQLYAIISNGLPAATSQLMDRVLRLNPNPNGGVDVTPLAPLGVNLGGAGTMEFDPASNSLFILEGTTGILRRVDLNGANPGASVVVGPAAIQNSAGLALATVQTPVAPRTVSVSDATISEGNQGSQQLTFTVTDTGGAGAISVNYQTVDGTATVANNDYMTTSSTLNFPAAGGQQQITVTINGDTAIEASEVFFLQLVSATGGAAIADGAGIGTITNDESGVAPTAIGDTLIGELGNDTITGHDGDEFIQGGSNHDSINGGGGNDIISGNVGNDTINGGLGNDTLSGDGGNDSVIGDAGEDTFIWTGTSGRDTMVGTSGADRLQINGTSGSDTFAVAASNRELLISSGVSSVLTAPTINEVTIDGLGGADSITVGDLTATRLFILNINGGGGNDLISAKGKSISNVWLSIDGGTGNDVLQGSLGRDTLRGGDGDDRLTSGGDNDLLLGQAGNDTLDGEAGNDIIYGDDIVDTIAGAATGGNDSIVGGDGDDSILGGGGNDNLDGGNDNDTIEGNDGDDVINGATGNDSLLGGIGADNLHGRNGDDTVDGGRNDDTLFGDAGNDRVLGDHGNDQIDAGEGDDTVLGGDGDDNIIGGDGNDAINAGDGFDTVSGDNGNDTVIGGDGNDLISGGMGQDYLLGRDGDDTINGGGQTDLIAGNQGNDILPGAAASEIDEAFDLNLLGSALLLSLNVTP